MYIQTKKENKIGGYIMGSKLRFGVIGLGKIGRVHLESLVNYINQAHVVHVADPYISDDLINWLQDNGIENISKDPIDILENKNVDAVMICSPTNMHAEQIIAAAKAGKHIFCEKPVDYDLNKIVEALDVVQRAGVKFQIGFNRRFDHNFKRIHNEVASGSIGNVQIVKITSRDPAPPSISYVKSSGGLFMDMMIHDFDMIRYISGKKVEMVYAQGSVLIEEEIGKVGDVDTAVVTIGFDDGAFGIIDNSRKAIYGYDQRAEVFGSLGCCMTDNDTATRVSLMTDKGAISDKPPYFFLERYFFAYVEEIKEFANSIIKKSPTKCGMYDAIMPVIMAKAAKLSLEQKKPITIKEILKNENINIDKYN